MEGPKHSVHDNDPSSTLNSYLLDLDDLPYATSVGLLPAHMVPCANMEESQLDAFEIWDPEKEKRSSLSLAGTFME